MKPVSGTIIYFNSGDALQVVIYFYIEPGKTYVFQGTTDGINYSDIFEFTAVPQQYNFSWTVTPAPGALWPRLLQK